MSDCENRHSSSPSRHSREGGNPQVFTAEYAEERIVKTLTTEAQRHKELPDGWCFSLLGELLTKIEAGKSFKCQERPPHHGEKGIVKISAVTWGEFDQLQSKTVFDESRLNSLHKIHSGDFLLSRANTIELVGAPVIVESVDLDLYLSDKVLRLQFAVTMDKFVLFFMRTKAGRRQIEEKSSGNQLSMRNIGQGRIREITMPLPPLNEQKRIVAKIEALQARSKAAREALAEVPKLVGQFKQSVLAAAFRGDLTKTWREQHPDVEPAEQLLARIRTERRTKWETDQLAAYEAKGKTPPKNWQSKYKVPEPVHATNLPEGWSKASLGEITSFVTSGSRGWAKYYSSDGSLFLRVGNLDRQTISLDLTDIQRVSPPPSAEGIRTRVQASDLLISITADLGMVAVIDDSLEESYVNQHISLVRPVLPMMSNYLGWFVTNPCAQQDLGLLGKGVGKTGLGLDDIRELEISIPTCPEQVQIIKCIETLFAYADSILEQAKASLDELDRLDQSILAKAFRGELVPQDPSDEPASVLLERIKAERTKVTPVKRSRKKATV